MGFVLGFCKDCDSAVRLPRLCDMYCIVLHMYSTGSGSTAGWVHWILLGYCCRHPTVHHSA
jgi:hypothetical protein